MSSTLFKSILLVSFLFVASCSRSVDREQSSALMEPAQKKNSFFVTVPIMRYSNSGTPCLEIGIEKNSYCIEIDLGDNGNLSLNTNIVEKIENKTFLREGTAVGIQGIPYPYRLYTLPEYWIGKSVFWNPEVSEDGGASTNGSFLAKAEEPELVPLPADGSMGWPCFSYTNLLLDLRNDQIAFCDRWERLEEEGYRRVHFTAVPISIEDFIMFDVDINGKIMSCMLDTGATKSILNTELPEGITLYERASDKSALALCRVNINGFDGGELSFLQIPVRLPGKIDAILGMDFIREHLVFIDFDHRMIYLSKSGRV